MSGHHGADPIDVRVAFRARCLDLARARGAGREEERVESLFLTDVDIGLGDGERPRDPDGVAPDRAPPFPATSSPDASTATPGPAPLLVVPGLLGDTVRALVAPFGFARDALRSEGRDVHVAWVNGRAGCTRNAARLRTVVLELAAANGGPIDVVGYSKGCPDTLHMLGDWPDTHEAVRSVVGLGGVVRGTPLADDAPSVVSRALRWLPLPAPLAAFGPGDGRAIADLSPALRRRWLDEHPLPTTIRYASIVATPSPDRVSRVLKASWRALSRTDPLNDSQVIARDAVLPRGELLATVDADHWALALPLAERRPLLARTFVDRNAFPRTVMLAALMDHLAAPQIAQTA